MCCTALLKGHEYCFIGCGVFAAAMNFSHVNGPLKCNYCESRLSWTSYHHFSLTGECCTKSHHVLPISLAFRTYPRRSRQLVTWCDGTTGCWGWGYPGPKLKGLCICPRCCIERGATGCVNEEHFLGKELEGRNPKPLPRGAIMSCFPTRINQKIISVTVTITWFFNTI